jgi:hypothetical protein
VSLWRNPGEEEREREKKRSGQIYGRNSGVMVWNSTPTLTLYLIGAARES